MTKNLIKRILSSIILIPLSIFFIFKGSIFFNIFILICFIISIYEWHLMSKKKIYLIPGIIFLIISFYSIYLIRNNFNEGYLYIFFILLVCVSTDIGGYIFGKLIKGPKLTKISPNKTYSGVIGAYLLSMFTSFLFLQTLTQDNNNFYNLQILFNVFLISSVSQSGDLIISCFKRLAHIEDTGKILPGHGGILDRIDGMIFAFPFCYTLLTLNLFNFLR